MPTSTTKASLTLNYSTSDDGLVAHWIKTGDLKELTKFLATLTGEYNSTRNNVRELFDNATSTEIKKQNLVYRLLFNDVKNRSSLIRLLRLHPALYNAWLSQLKANKGTLDIQYDDNFKSAIDANDTLLLKEQLLVAKQLGHDIAYDTLVNHLMTQKPSINQLSETLATLSLSDTLKNFNDSFDKIVTYLKNKNRIKKDVNLNDEATLKKLISRTIEQGNVGLFSILLDKAIDQKFNLIDSTAKDNNSIIQQIIITQQTNPEKCSQFLKLAFDKIDGGTLKKLLTHSNKAGESPIHTLLYTKKPGLITLKANAEKSEEKTKLVRNGINEENESFYKALLGQDYVAPLSLLLNAHVKTETTVNIQTNEDERSADVLTKKQRNIYGQTPFHLVFELDNAQVAEAAFIKLLAAAERLSEKPDFKQKNKIREESIYTVAMKKRLFNLMNIVIGVFNADAALSAKMKRITSATKEDKPKITVDRYRQDLEKETALLNLAAKNEYLELYDKLLDFHTNNSKKNTSAIAAATDPSKAVPLLPVFSVSQLEESIKVRNKIFNLSKNSMNEILLTIAETVCPFYGVAEENPASEALKNLLKSPITIGPIVLTSILIPIVGLTGAALLLGSAIIRTAYSRTIERNITQTRHDLAMFTRLQQAAELLIKDINTFESAIVELNLDNNQSEIKDTIQALTKKQSALTEISKQLNTYERNSDYQKGFSSAKNELDSTSVTWKEKALSVGSVAGLGMCFIPATYGVANFIAATFIGAGAVAALANPAGLLITGIAALILVSIAGVFLYKNVKRTLGAKLKARRDARKNMYEAIQGNTKNSNDALKVALKTRMENALTANYTNTDDPESIRESLIEKINKKPAAVDPAINKKELKAKALENTVKKQALEIQALKKKLEEQAAPSTDDNHDGHAHNFGSGGLLASLPKPSEAAANDEENEEQPNPS